MHRRTRALASWAALVVLAACGSSEAASPDVPATVSDVGVLPGTFATEPTTASTAPPSSSAPDDTAPDSTVAASARTTTTTERVTRGASTIGGVAEGNRVLVIGDSILASISNRYGDQLCQHLVPRGWAVEIDAEVGRFIRFGRQVLDERNDAGWDAAVVMLGNNYDGDPVAFARELELLLDELEPLPVLLLTVTRFEPAQDEVNFILIGEAGRHEGVRLVDWTTPTAEDTAGSADLLTGDGLHLTTEGQEALATLIGGAMGRAPQGSAGECLRSSFRDDGGSMPADDDDVPNDPDETDTGGISRPSGGRTTTTTTARRAEPDPPATVAEPAPTDPPVERPPEQRPPDEPDPPPPAGPPTTSPP